MALGYKISPNTVAEMAAGKGHPQSDKITAVAAALDVEPPGFELDDGKEPTDASGWIGQAQAALERAAERLRAPATGEPVVEAEQAGEDVRPALDAPTSTDVA